MVLPDDWVWDDVQIQIGTCNQLPFKLWSSFMNFLFIIKAKILVLIKRSYMFPQWCWLSNIFWAHSPIFLKHVYFVGVHVLDPRLTAYHSNVGVQIIAKFDLCPLPT